MPAAISGGGEGEPLLVETADGARLSLLRYPGSGPPVLLVHGLASNRRTFDLEPVEGKGFRYVGLAAHLRERGYDVWLLNLRGAGRGEEESRPPPGRPGWTIDEHAVEDLTAAIERIRRDTRRRPLIAGHSLGALSALIHLEGARWEDPSAGRRRVVLDAELARERQEAVRGLVLIAPPVRMAWSGKRARDDLARAARFVFSRRPELLPERIRLSRLVFEDREAFLDSLPGRLLEAAGVFQGGGPEDEVLDFAFGPARNRSTKLIAKVIDGVLSDCSRDVLLQFLDGVAAGTIRSAGPDPVEYPPGYPAIATPMLVLAGERDRIVEAQVVRQELIDRSEGDLGRRLIVVPGYGHADLLLGTRAPEEIYPIIESWLQIYGSD